MKRVLKWFARHKVTAVFAVLVLAIALWFLGSLLVWNVQVHFERERFNAVAQKMREVQHGMRQNGFPDSVYSAGCVHSNFGIVFGSDTIACSAKVDVIYAGLNAEDALQISRKAKTTIVKYGLSLKPRMHNYNADNILAYDFEYQKMDCSLDTLYYNPASLATIPIWVTIRPVEKPMTLLEVECGGSARLDYFPVTNN